MKQHQGSLPEPRHPFAKWFAGAAISFWALGVQSLHDPWNKLGAILSPGVGYVLGFALENAIDYSRVLTSLIRTHMLKKKMERLYAKQQHYVRTGMNAKVIEVITLEIDQCHRRLLKTLGS